MGRASKLLAHDNIRGIRVLQGVWHSLISEELIHLFQSPPFCLGEEEEITACRNQVPGKEEIEEAEAKILQRNRGALCEDQIQRPISEGRQRISTSSDFGRKDLQQGQ